MSEYAEDARFKLDEAKYYYEQMQLNFQDRRKFRFNLDAFLSAARAVTFVFQNARNKVDESVMKWYDAVTDGWKKDEVMRLLVEMRDVSIHEHTPQMQTTAAVHASIDVMIVDRRLEQGTKPSQEIPQQSRGEPQAPATPKIISYSFHELPEWFDQDSDVMHLCEEWLGRLEKFITEAERKVKGGAS